MKPCLIEWRLTTDVDDNIGMHTFFPWGIVANVLHQYQRVDIKFSAPQYNLQLLWDDGWNDEFVNVVDVDGAPMYKFLRPTVPTSFFQKERWFNNGKEYMLEIRIKQWLGE